MKYIVRKSIIEIVGRIWMPAVVCSQRQVLSDYDIRNMKDNEGNITRESIGQWLCSNSGDFATIIDFCASVEDGDKSVEIPWATEEGESAYLDTLSEPCEA